MKIWRGIPPFHPPKKKKMRGMGENVFTYIEWVRKVKGWGKEFYWNWNIAFPFAFALFRLISLGPLLKQNMLIFHFIHNIVTLYLNQKKKRKCPFVNAIVSLVFPLPLSTSIGLLSILSPKKIKKSHYIFRTTQMQWGPYWFRLISLNTHV